jgi:glycosyltransferase EpsF
VVLEENKITIKEYTKMPVRVLHIIGNIAKGGIESVVFNYYRYIDRDKVQFDFVAHEDSPFEIPDDIKALGCKVYKVPHYKHLSAYIKALETICSGGEYKIVHSHMNALSVFGLYAAKRAGVPIRIAHSHSTAVWGVKTEFKRSLLKVVLRPFAKIFPTHLFACSIHAGNWLYGKKAMESDKVTVLPNAIDTAQFSYSEANRERIRMESGYADDNYVISHIGRFVPQKNHGYILDIFFEAYKKDNHLRLLLIGDGPGKPEITQRAEEFNRGSGVEAVIMLDSRDNVNEYYSAMDLFMLPSLYEGLGIVAVEAQCAGLPCICSANVPTEANAGNAKFIPLANRGEWRDEILLLSKSVNEARRKAISDAFPKDWDIVEKAKYLEDFYLFVSRVQLSESA